jgi:hypothetical protein
VEVVELIAAPFLPFSVLLSCALLGFGRPSQVRLGRLPQQPNFVVCAHLDAFRCSTSGEDAAAAQEQRWQQQHRGPRAAGW